MFCRAAKVLDGMELTSFQIMDVEVSEKVGSLRNRWSAGEVEGGLSASRCAGQRTVQRAMGDSGYPVAA